MIHLLEENKDERTNNIAEELILYGFLGVFMIFIVDSFIHFIPGMPLSTLCLKIPSLCEPLAIRKHPLSLFVS